MESQFWAGTEGSFNSYLAQQKYLNDHSVVTEGVQAFYDDDDEDESGQHDYGAHLVSVKDGTAIVNISGTLVPKFSWYNQWFGLVSYEEIINALDIAAKNTDANNILLKISSGGGAVTGLDETAQFISHIDKNIKPVYAHTGSLMASGAYWLAASARRIYASKISEIGSIGVLMVHQSYARLLKERGIDAKVFRAGKYKALGHPAEKLSAIAIADIESKLGKTYNFFLEHVSSNRNVSLSNKDNWAEGKVFYAEDAFSVNLIDGIKYFNETVEILSRADDNPYLRMSVDSQGSDDMTVKTKNVVASEQELAAIQSGASAAELSTQVEVLDEGVEPEVKTPEPEIAPETPDESGLSEEPEAKVEKPQPAQQVISGVDPVLYGETCARVAVLEKELSDTTAKLETAETESNLLTDIAVKATNRFQIALNQSPTALGGVAASIVLETYAAVETQFNDTFKVGKTSANVNTEADQKTHPARSGIYPVNAK